MIAAALAIALTAAAGWLVREIRHGRVRERMAEENDDLHAELSDEHARAIKSIIEIGALKRDRNLLAEENLRLRNRLRELESAREQMTRLGQEAKS